jgi:hypothetical protein
MFQVLPHFETFPKSLPYFLLIFERKHKRFTVGAGIKSFFKFNILPIDVMFFLWNWKKLRTNIFWCALWLYLPLNYMVCVVHTHNALTWILLLCNKFILWHSKWLPCHAILISSLNKLMTQWFVIEWGTKE